MSFLAWIIVGLIAGWLAGQVMKGGGYGVLVDIVLGILGGVVGGLGFRAARNMAGKRDDWFDCGGVHRCGDPCVDYSVGQKSLRIPPRQIEVRASRVPPLRRPRAVVSSPQAMRFAGGLVCPPGMEWVVGWSNQ